MYGTSALNRHQALVLVSIESFKPVETNLLSKFGVTLLWGDLIPAHDDEWRCLDARSHSRLLQQFFHLHDVCEHAMVPPLLT